MELVFISVLLIFVIIGLFMCMKKKDNFQLANKPYHYQLNKLHMKNRMATNKYTELLKILGKPTYIEKGPNSTINSVTWMEELDNFSASGKFGGADYIKLYGKPSKKWHPHPANVFIIVGKYINVPDHLLGPLKYASETINIEQLFIPKQHSDKYYNTGAKEVALVTGSCASVTISAITVQFVIDMINKYRNDTDKGLELYNEFRKEYDRRINKYLCGDGYDPIDWFDHAFFNEARTVNLGEEKCGTKNVVVENFGSCNARPLERFGSCNTHKNTVERFDCCNNKEGGCNCEHFGSCNTHKNTVERFGSCNVRPLERFGSCNVRPIERFGSCNARPLERFGSYHTHKNTVERFDCCNNKEGGCNCEHFGSCNARPLERFGCCNNKEGGCDCEHFGSCKSCKLQERFGGYGSGGGGLMGAPFNENFYNGLGDEIAGDVREQAQRKSH